jgi:hypothetical protein
MGRYSRGLRDNFINVLQLSLLFIFCIVPASYSQQSQLPEIEFGDCGTYGGDPYWGYEIFEKTLNIPANFGVTFGCTVKLKNASDMSFPAFQGKWTHPGMQLPSSQAIRYDHVVTNSPSLALADSTPVVFTFTESWELVPGTWNLTVLYHDQIVGEQSFAVHHVEQSDYCSQVAESFAVSMIQGCRSEPIQYNAQEAYLVSLAYGPGMDCPSGCFYQYAYAVLLRDGSIYPVDDREFVDSEEKVAEAIWREIMFPITKYHVEQATDRMLVKKKEQYAVQYGFNEYVEGHVSVFADGHVEADVLPGPEFLGFDQAKEIAVQELKRLGYIESNLQIEAELARAETTSGLGWFFRVRGYQVTVFIDGTVRIAVRNRTRHATKQYGPFRIALDKACLLAESELRNPLGVDGFISTSNCHQVVDVSCRLVTIAYKAPIEDELYEVNIQKNGTVDISYNGEFLAQTAISKQKLQGIPLEDLREYEAIDLAEEELVQAGVSLEECQLGLQIHENSGQYLYSITFEKQFCTAQKYTAKVCEDGLIQISQDGKIIHQRNVLSDRQ